MTIQQTHTDVVAGRPNRIAKVLSAASVVIVLLLSGVAAGADYLLETSRPGVFAAGDVRSGSSKRCATAVGEGAMAVMFVHAHLSRTSAVERAK